MFRFSFFIWAAAVLLIASGGASAPDRSLSPGDPDVVPNAEGCTFCTKMTDPNGVTHEACDTIGACASNQVCSGEGGVRNGRPWAKAKCIPAEQMLNPEI